MAERAGDKQQLQGKSPHVLHRRHSGERASALMDVLTKTSEGAFQTDGPPIILRGGIERYMKTFPEGYWKDELPR